MPYLHDLDPFAIHFYGDVGLRWYGLAYLSAFLTGYLTIIWFSARGRSTMKPEQVSDFTTAAAIGVMLGGRLGYCLFYAPDLFLEFNTSFPFWGVLEVHKGGMASHGGIIGVIVACWWFGRKYQLDVWHLLDLTTLAGALGFFFGRLANFVNGELYGRECSAEHWSATLFPQEIYRWMGYTPERLQKLGEAVSALGPVQLPGVDTAVQVLRPEAWRALLNQPSGLARQQVNWIIEQLLLATQSGNAVVQDALRLVLTPRYPSQLFQALFEGLGVFLILMLIWYRPRKPGVIGCMFCILYGIARIIGEQFRMPDAHIGYQLWGLTRGQWLSVAMILGVTVLLIFVSQRRAPKTGGWGSVS